MTETEWWVMGGVGVVLMVVSVALRTPRGRAILNLTACIVAAVLLALPTVPAIDHWFLSPTRTFQSFLDISFIGALWVLWWRWLVRAWAGRANLRRKQAAPSPAGVDPAAPRTPR
jgi:hypothetical protein